MLFQIMWVHLLLLTVLLGVSTACPLILEPYQKTDDQIFLNCTSLADGHKGMYWSYNNQTTNKESESYTEVSISGSDRNTTAKCTIKLNDTFECSKYIQLKIYDVKKITEIEKKQREFKCDIPEAEPVQNLSVKWFKDEQIIGPESTPEDMHAPLVWNISRDHDGANFSCEALGHQEPHGQVYVSMTWSLHVEYAPKFEDKNETTVHLNKSGDTSLDCATEGSPPPDYTWLKNGSIVANTRYLNIIQVNETTTYYCNASNHIGFDTRTFVVAVSSRSSESPMTIIPNELFVEYGGSASANCSPTENIISMGWEADEGGISLTENVTSLEWKVKKVGKWTMKAMCFINTKIGGQYFKSLNITIYKLPDKVQVSPEGNHKLVEGQQHKLQCKISNVAPVEKVQVKWYRDNQLLYRETFNEIVSESQNKTSIFTLSPKKEHNKANFTCEIELLLKQGQNPKVVSAPYTADVQYKPIQHCPLSYTGKENEFKLDTVPCKPSGNPEPDTYWYYNDILVNSTEPRTRKDSGTYTAIFKNDIGNTSTSVNITIEYGPLFSCEDHYDVIEKTNFKSPCEPEGIPKPKSVWLKDETQMHFSKQWKRHDSGQYLIAANSTLGKVNHTLRINVLYPPSLTENITQEFHMGENLTLKCNADGNPLPQLHWNHPNASNVNTTRGRQIYITEATSTNAGLYLCIATNKLGSVTRTVTLILKETHSNLKRILIFVFLLALVLAIFILVLVYRNYKKKSGQYNVIAISDSLPLTSR